jgi:hypothetical protein
MEDHAWHWPAMQMDTAVHGRPETILCACTIWSKFYMSFNGHAFHSQPYIRVPVILASFKALTVICGNKDDFYTS